MEDESEVPHDEVEQDRNNPFHYEPHRASRSRASSINTSFRSVNRSFSHFLFGDDDPAHAQHHRHLRPDNPINTYEITKDEIIFTPRHAHPQRSHLRRGEEEEEVDEEETKPESGAIDAYVLSRPVEASSFATFSAAPSMRGEDEISFRGSFVGSTFHGFHPPSRATSRVPSLAPSVSSESDDLPVAPYGWVSIKEFPQWYWKRLTGPDQSLNAYTFSPDWDQLIAFVFTVFTLVVFAIVQNYVFTPLIDGSLNIFIPAFGATCTCLFSVPKLPISQPRNVLVAYVSAGVIGTTLLNALIYLPEQPYGAHIAGAIGVGLHQIFMVFTDTLHPPASATVVSAVEASFQTYYHDRGYLFCVTPCISGSILVILMAILLNNLVPSRSPYPQYW